MGDKTNLTLEEIGKIADFIKQEKLSSFFTSDLVNGEVAHLARKIMIKDGYSTSLPSPDLINDIVKYYKIAEIERAKYIHKRERGYWFNSQFILLSTKIFKNYHYF